MGDRSRWTDSVTRVRATLTGSTDTSPLPKTPQALSLTSCSSGTKLRSDSLRRTKSAQWCQACSMGTSTTVDERTTIIIAPRESSAHSIPPPRAT
jgi:hypothetical protein